MSLLAHITMHEVGFVLAVFLFGLASGYTMGWSRQTAPERQADSQLQARRRS